MIHLSLRDFGCTGTIAANRKYLPGDIKTPPKSLEKGQTLIKREGILLTMVHRGKRHIRLATTIDGAKMIDGKPYALLQYKKYIGALIQ